MFARFLYFASVLCLTMTVLTPRACQCAEEEHKLVPSQDPFFQPTPDNQFQDLPSAEGGSEPGEFWTPETADFFEDLPRAIDEDGNPTNDVDERFWEQEFGELFREVKSDWIQSGGYLEFRGDYSTNIDLSAPDYDSDLRINPNETEVADYYQTISLGYEHEFELSPDDLKGAVRYDFLLHDYTTYNREDNNVHRLELATVKKLSDDFEWEVFGGGQTDHRDRYAQYYQPDHNQWHVGTEFRKSFSEKVLATLGYQYRNRDYDKLRGEAPPETPFKDWYEHRFYGTYVNNLTDKLSLNLGLSFAKRNHESITLDEFGARIPGEYRKYDLWEPVIALTSTPNDNQQITVYYRYRSLSSTGSFYDYNESVTGLLFEQKICPSRFSGLVLRSSLEYGNKNYDAQVTEGSFGTGNPTVRDDERYTAYLALEKTIDECLTTGIDFYYTDNDSNDHSSKYQEDRYGFYLRYDF
ncbi:MAG: hypothetical protein H6751_17005 [Candidatus Omnitrophica bacterium]|nr:hypothetical protein [Candidatus Omnitrophota bacterium]